MDAWCLKADLIYSHMLVVHPVKYPILYLILNRLYQDKTMVFVTGAFTKKEVSYYGSYCITEGR